MSSNTVKQQNHPIHYSPLIPPYELKSSLIHRDSKLTSFCQIKTIQHILDLPHLNTTCKNENLTSSKTNLHLHFFALYDQELKNFQNKKDNEPFNLKFNFDKTRTHTCQPSFLH